MTSFVDAGTTGPGLLLGVVPGRSGACARTWLGEQAAEFRAGIELVVIDPSAQYASGIRAALPHPRIAVNHWHLVRLANDMATEVRQTRHPNPARTPRARVRSGVGAPADAPDRRHRLSRRQLRRLDRVLAADDATGEIGAACGCKELLRQLLAGNDPTRMRRAVSPAMSSRRGARTVAGTSSWMGAARASHRSGVQ